MAKSPLILAALAKDAVPQLDFVQAFSLDTDSSGNFHSTLLTAKDGSHYVVKQAALASAEATVDTELTALRALAPFREHFPFAVTSLVGTGRDPRGKRVLVYRYLYGEPIDVSRLSPQSPLLGSLAHCLAAIHSVPVRAVEDAGLPSYSPQDILRQSVAAMDRMAQTGRVSAVLLNRWEQAFEDINLWHFQPAVTHGAIAHNVLGDKSSVTGVLSWDHLSVSDPAVDFSWIQGAASDDFAYSLFLEYEQLRQADANLRARALLYSELDYGSYLLSALASGDQAHIDEAQALIDQLAAEVEAGNRPQIGPKPLVSEVEVDSFEPIAATFVAGEAAATGFEYSDDSTAPIEIQASAGYQSNLTDESSAAKPAAGDSERPELF